MGKSSIVYVIGLSLLVAYGLLNINESSNSSMDTYTEYYGRSMTHNIALAGANIGTRAILNNPTYSTNLLDQDFAGGKFNMYVTHTIDSAFVTSAAWMNVSGQTIRDTVIAVLRHTPFSKFGYFSEKEENGYLKPNDNTPPGGNMWKVTGDSMFGFSHTNKRWNLGGRPYFHDKVTAFNTPNTMLYGGVYDPVFNSGYQWGVTINRPIANLTRLETEAINGSATPNMSFIENNDASFNFFPDGRVHVRVPPATGAVRNDTLPISSISSTGVIAVKNGDIRVQGTYNGAVTLVALKGSGIFKGNVWIDGNIVANTNPNGNEASPDMLGLVAQRMSYLTKDLSRTSASVVNIQAAIYTHDGVFAAEEYNTIPVSGRINLFGALAMAASTSTGKITGGVLTNGFLKSIRHDPRYLASAPPAFPFSNKMELVSWWEN